MKSIQYTVRNPLGIHARPAALLAQACTNFKELSHDRMQRKYRFG